MVNLDQIKITRRDTEVLKLLVEGCSNREVRFAVGPKWCFAAVGLSIRVLCAARPYGRDIQQGGSLPASRGPSRMI
jgi:hypothetical protein